MERVDEQIILVKRFPQHKISRSTFLPLLFSHTPLCFTSTLVSDGAGFRTSACFRFLQRLYDLFLIRFPEPVTVFLYFRRRSEPAWRHAHFLNLRLFILFRPSHLLVFSMTTFCPTSFLHSSTTIGSGFFAISVEPVSGAGVKPVRCAVLVVRFGAQYCRLTCYWRF